MVDADPYVNCLLVFNLDSVCSVDETGDSSTTGRWARADADPYATCHPFTCVQSGQYVMRLYTAALLADG